MKYVALTLALVGAAGLYVGAKVLQQDPATPASGWEVWVFVLDKTSGKSVDLTDWNAELEIEPRGGKEQKVPMEKSTAGGKPADPGAKPEDRKVEPKPAMGSKPLVCAQVKDMDRYYVELAVVNPAWMHKGMFPGGKKDVVQGNGEQHKGYFHDHGGAYFKASLPRTWWGEAKPGALAFEADVHFTYGTEKKSVKGFSYPFGLYKDVLQKVMDEDLRQARDHVRANDPAKWKEVGERIMGKAHALPDLTFKKNEDRDEFERARRDCMAACQRIMNATTKEQATEAIDQCKDKCDDYQDEAQDAEGVNWEFKGFDPKTTEPKTPERPPDTRK
jgi:hypothetical protein